MNDSRKEKPVQILVVEDDAKVAASLQQGLRESGHHVLPARSAEQAAVMLRENALHLIILDLGLPGRDGLDFLHDLRAAGNPVPVIVLTARDRVEDRVTGLNAGADDYLVKPFAFAELLARVRALDRRAHDREATHISVGDLRIDLASRMVRRDGSEIELTQKEFDLLVYLARAGGQVVSRDMMARDIWKITSRATPMDNIIDVHMSHLREKIDRPFERKLLRTVRGVGFALGDNAS
jgi:DNA-binding response OmpR family regulator